MRSAVFHFAAFVGSLVLSGCLLAGCGRVDPPSQSKIAVGVSILPQKWLVEQIAGDRAEVLVVVAPGESPATYQPSDLQVSRVLASRVYFRIGVPFERGQWANAIATSSKLKIVDTQSAVALRPMKEHHDHMATTKPDAHGDLDPHIWLSPKALKQQAGVIAQTLAEVDVAHRETYLANLQKVEKQLDEVDAQIRTILADAKARSFFVFHPSWGYFAHDYGLEQFAIELEGKEPTDSELTHFQTLARREGVTCVFVQKQISSRSAEAVAKAIGGHVSVLDPLAPDVPQNLVRVAQAIANKESASDAAIRH